MNNELMTIADRIGKKSVAVSAGAAKVTNLRAQIALYQASIDKVEVENEMKKAEIELLVSIQSEAMALVKKRDELLRYTDGLRAKFDAFEWSMDMPFEQKLESTDYHQKVAERFEINAELDELVKRANKIYYRR